MGSLVQDAADSAIGAGGDPPADKVHVRSGWRAGAAVLALGILAASGMWQLRLFNREMPQTRSDLVPVWVGTRATLHGQDAYSDEATRASQTLYYGRPLTPQDSVNKMGYAYPAYTAVVLAGLTLLPWANARLAFLAIAPLCMCWSVWAWLRIGGMQVSRRRLALVVLLALVSWPMLWAFRLQQVTLIVAVLLTAGCFLLKRRWEVSAGVVLSLALIKPQLAAPLIAWLLLWAATQRRWRFAAAVVGAAGGLFLSAAWLAPGWIPRWLAAVADYNRYIHPEPMLQSIFGEWAGGALMLAMGVYAALVLWRVRGCSVDSKEFGAAAGLTLALTVALQPTTTPMIYNEVLLIPGLLIVVNDKAKAGFPGILRRLAIAALNFRFLAVPVAVACEVFAGPRPGLMSLPFINPLLPVLVTLALVLQPQSQAELEVATEAR